MVLWHVQHISHIMNVIMSITYAVWENIAWNMPCNLPTALSHVKWSWKSLCKIAFIYFTNYEKLSPSYFDWTNMEFIHYSRIKIYADFQNTEAAF